MSKSPDRRDERRGAELLAGRLTPGADAAQVAATTVALWHAIDLALSPVVGARGVAALYNRSLRLVIDRHAGLGDVGLDVLAAMDLAALKAALERQAPAEAAAASADLFRAFRQLLSSLVGVALSDRLLRSVTAHSAGEPPAQDTSS